jgi:hypothetical protein
MKTYAASCAVTVSLRFVALTLKKGEIMNHNLFCIPLLFAVMAVLITACSTPVATSVPMK